MAFTEDAVKAKLSALNETQDSIVSVAQWILFHRRHAPKTAKIWQQRLADSQAPKRLNLLYLANEVIQQSKARKKDDFLLAFSPIIADATVTAFKGAPGDIQQKIRRMVDVWRQRNIFDSTCQESIEKSVDAIESTRRRPMLGGSLFPGSGSGNADIPPELKTLADLQTTLTRHELSIKPTLSTSTTEYASLLPAGQSTASLPKQAAQLAALQKSLASASDAVAASIAARKALVTELSRLIEQNQAAAADEATQLQDVDAKRPAVDARRREVEDQIMRGLGDAGDDGDDAEPDRPEMEPLTPPSAPLPNALEDAPVQDSHTPEGEPPSMLSPSGMLSPPPAPLPDAAPAVADGKAAGAGKRESSGSHAGQMNGGGTVKRRKTNTWDEVYEGLEESDIDDEVKGILG